MAEASRWGPLGWDGGRVEVDGVFLGPLLIFRDVRELLKPDCLRKSKVYCVSTCQIS
jgi:hypothetical protein